jgi:DNA-binding NtrC family response regulator
MEHSHSPHQSNLKRDIHSEKSPYPTCYPLLGWQAFGDGQERDHPQYTWLGNIRELKNRLLEAAAYTQSQSITAGDLPDMITRAAAAEDSQSRRQVLDRAEADLIVQALQQAGSVTQAALRLGLHEATLYRKMKKYGVPLPQNQNKH